MPAKVGGKVSGSKTLTSQREMELRKMRNPSEFTRLIVQQDLEKP